MAQKRKLVIEVCANGLDSARNAQRAGANRIELCDFLEAGGITPTSDMISVVKERMVLPIHVLIRPRPGNFIYSVSEFKKMRHDVMLCREFGLAGVVLGLLDEEDQVNVQRCRELVKLAQPMSVTFHRAFDKVKDPMKAMEQLIDLGFQRILTSGQKENALEGSALIAALIHRANGQISIMPGGGITEENISEIVAATGAHEFHFSAKVKTEDGQLVSDENRIRNIKEIAEKTFYAH